MVTAISIMMHHIFLHKAQSESVLSKCTLLALCGQDDGSANILDLLLSQFGDEPGLDNHGLVGQLTLTQHLENAKLGYINHRRDARVLGMALAGLQASRLLSVQRPMHI